MKYLTSYPATYYRADGREYNPELNDGPGSSSRGHFDKVGDFVYWEDGTVTDLRIDGVGFVLCDEYRPPEERTRYSTWTPEQRQAAIEARETARLKMANECAIREEETDRLIASAKSKLTPEEYDAIYSASYDYGYNDG